MELRGQVRSQMEFGNEGQLYCRLFPHLDKGSEAVLASAFLSITWEPDGSLYLNPNVTLRL
jgi:hypothetical protein